MLELEAADKDGKLYFDLYDIEVIFLSGDPKTPSLIFITDRELPFRVTEESAALAVTAKRERRRRFRRSYSGANPEPIGPIGGLQ